MDCFHFSERYKRGYNPLKKPSILGRPGSYVTTNAYNNLLLVVCGLGLSSPSFATPKPQLFCPEEILSGNLYHFNQKLCKCKTYMCMLERKLFSQDLKVVAKGISVPNEEKKHWNI